MKLNPQKIIFFVFIVFAVFLSGCGEKYPNTKAPPNALARSVTTQLDKDIGAKAYPLDVVFNSSGRIEMETGPKLYEGYAMTFADGTNIIFTTNKIVIGDDGEEAQFNSGDKLVKIDGLWCLP